MFLATYFNEASIEKIMGRVADSTIKGFMYQFNLTLNKILKASDDIIKVEGIVEDIDVSFNDHVTAIQCKYHEEQQKFQWSTVYKPILQMMKTFCMMDRGLDIKFILYAYFPNEKEGKKLLNEKQMENILKTDNIEYICDYIAYLMKIENAQIEQLLQKPRKTKTDKEKIKKYFAENNLEIKCDLKDFLEKHFEFIVGKPYDELEKENKELLEEAGFEKDDVSDIVYPNAIQKIADLSIIKNDNSRNITKDEMTQYLRMIKTAAITRWTRSLSNYGEVIKRKRKQLNTYLNINKRKRCFFIDPVLIENFDNDIVLFLKNYVTRYCCKVKLHTPAVFCFVGYTHEQIDELESRLYLKGIEAETGYRGKTFFEETFIKEPEKRINDGWMQYRIKLCTDEAACIAAINKEGQDDIFLIADRLPVDISVQDVNVEVVNLVKLSHLEYILKIRDEVEL
ncbi:hypothetical protein D5281_23875 [bacterium 1xD42-62]|uniref:Uncharacterized protein n=2 Tax=Parablautia muri TaxID=2320879 RepID=A0A9X5BKN5_9FIRM|nr:hypothetical protein [Parablautia muri]